MSTAADVELKRVQTALHQHRCQFGRRRIPDAIRQQILSLLVVYPRKHVVNTLGISYKMLCRWEEDVRVENTRADAQAMAFVELPTETASLSDLPRDLPAIELRLSDEVVLAFHGSTGLAHCLPLLKGLGYGCAEPTFSQLAGVSP